MNLMKKTEINVLLLLYLLKSFADIRYSRFDLHM